MMQPCKLPRNFWFLHIEVICFILALNHIDISKTPSDQPHSNKPPNIVLSLLELLLNITTPAVLILHLVSFQKGVPERARQ